MNIMIVLNYNDYETTHNYINKVKSYEILDRIIIIDNYSTDNSYFKLKKMESEKVIVIQTSQNKGYGEGNNFGMKYAEENFEVDYFIISNPDIEVRNKTISNIVKHLEENENEVAASGLILDRQEKIANNFAWRLPSYSNLLFRSSLILTKTVTLFNKSYIGYDLSRVESNLLQVDVISGCFFIIKANVIKEVNYFDSRTFLYNEENILAYKLKSKNYKQVILLNEKIIHYEGASVNKSINSLMSKLNILKRSREIYLMYYLNCSKKKMNLFHIIFTVGKYEKVAIQFIRRIKNKIA